MLSYQEAMSLTPRLPVSDFQGGMFLVPKSDDYHNHTAHIGTGPAINGTGFVALVDSADTYTVANLSLVIPHMVAGVGSISLMTVFFLKLTVLLSIHSLLFSKPDKRNTLIQPHSLG